MGLDTVLCCLHNMQMDSWESGRLCVWKQTGFVLQRCGSQTELNSNFVKK